MCSFFDPKLLAEIVKDRRSQLGLTQCALAVASGLSQSLVSLLEAGIRADYSFQTLAQIASALQLTLVDLLRPCLTEAGQNLFTTNTGETHDKKAKTYIN